MDQRPVVINLPAELYDRIRRAAAERNRPIEAVLLDSLALLFGDMPNNPEAALEALENYSDGPALGRHLSTPDLAGRGSLAGASGLGKQGRLSTVEQSELNHLLELVDNYTLLRSRAILLLKSRGYDVESRLKLSA